MDHKFSTAVEAIYAAAAQPASWPLALQSVADCFGDVGGLLIYARDDGSFATIVSPSLEDCAAAYQREWWKHDIRQLRAVEHVYSSNRCASTDRYLVTEEEIETHPIYTQFLASFGLRWAAALNVSPRAGVDVGLSIQRALTKPPFSDEELDLLTSLGRHLEQALRLSLRLIDAELVGLGLGDALARLSIGAFVVDAGGKSIFANRKAEDLLKSVFVLNKSILACRSAPDQKRFAAMLNAIALRQTSAASDDPTDLAPILIDRPDGSGRLAIYGLPLYGPDDGADLMREGRMIILAIDLVPGAPVDPALVRDVYGLTLGEARVASLVGAGISPQEAANQLSVAEATIRSALKRVFVKLGVTRQPELTALLAQLKMADHRGA